MIPNFNTVYEVLSYFYTTYTNEVIALKSIKHVFKNVSHRL